MKKISNAVIYSWIKIRIFILQLHFIMTTVPFFRKFLWKNFYNNIGYYVPSEDFNFINLGYAELNPKANNKPIENISQINHFSEQLYQHVIGNRDIREKEVLEVGCGRGGGSVYVMRQFAPKKLTAVDISDKAIDRCSDIHKSSGIHFLQADATALPFADNSFDVVINIESSHCYPSRAHFFAEVSRVLRPGGMFMFADIVFLFIDRKELTSVQTMLEKCGLNILEAEDITKNVLKARDLMSKSIIIEDLIIKWGNNWLKKFSSAFTTSFKQIFCLKGSKNYKLIEDGKMVYWKWMLQKPE